MSKDQREILFVAGAARSGTTYVTDVLDDLFGYGMGPEGHFVLDFEQRLNRYGDLAVEQNMRRLMNDIRNASTLSIIRNEWPPEARFDVTVDELMARVETPDYAGAVYAVFRAVADHLGQPNVGTKNPTYTLHLRRLERLFPGRARYLNVIRDGRDVALSTMRMSWGQDSAYACAKSWAAHIEAASLFEQRIGPARFMNLCYEDIVAKPDSSLERLESFLGREVEASLRERFLEQARQNDLAANFGKWRDEMAATDVERFEAIAGEQLERCGYERLYDNPRPISWVDATRFEVQEVWRKIRATLGNL